MGLNEERSCQAGGCVASWFGAVVVDVIGSRVSRRARYLEPYLSEEDRDALTSIVKVCYVSQKSCMLILISSSKLLTPETFVLILMLVCMQCLARLAVQELGKEQVSSVRTTMESCCPLVHCSRKSRLHTRPSFA